MKRFLFHMFMILITGGLWIILGPIIWFAKQK